MLKACVRFFSKTLLLCTVLCLLGLYSVNANVINGGSIAGRDDDPISIPDLKIVMQLIPAGNITLRNASSAAVSDEKELTQVTLSKFWLGETEVTQAQYEAIMGDNSSYFKGPDLPMEQVSWEDAMAFCHKLNEREHAAGRLPAGYTYKLPTEAQWEYACRAGTTGDFAGNLDAMGWYAENAKDKTHPVATKQANAWGLYDMHGNIREWCLDWYASSYPAGSVTDYAGPASGTLRVSRGGNWHRPEKACTSSNRGYRSQGRRDDLHGLRIALSSIPELKIAMVPIPAGTFTMGSTSLEAADDEKTLTEVTLSEFWLGATEVTQSQFKTIMGAGSPCFQGYDLPMEQASWEDAMALCHKLNERERAAGRLPAGYVYTLPTEAQWEYACRAGTTGDYTGDPNAMAWNKTNSDNKTHPVSTKQPNAWGLYDMQGNVRELCLDWYADSYPGGSVTNYAGPESGAYRVCRGAGWGDSAESCRSSNRGYRSEGRRADLLGFRIALSPIQ